MTSRSAFYHLSKQERKPEHIFSSRLLQLNALLNENNQNYLIDQKNLQKVLIPTNQNKTDLFLKGQVRTEKKIQNRKVNTALNTSIKTEKRDHSFESLKITTKKQKINEEGKVRQFNKDPITIDLDKIEIEQMESHQMKQLIYQLKNIKNSKRNQTPSRKRYFQQVRIRKN